MPRNQTLVRLVLTDEDEYPLLWTDCVACGRQGEWNPEDGTVEHLGADEPCVVQVRAWRCEVAA